HTRRSLGGSSPPPPPTSDGRLDGGSIVFITDDDDTSAEPQKVTVTPLEASGGGFTSANGAAQPASSKRRMRTATSYTHRRAERSEASRLLRGLAEEDARSMTHAAFFVLAIAAGGDFRLHPVVDGHGFGLLQYDHDWRRAHLMVSFDSDTLRVGGTLTRGR